MKEDFRFKKRFTILSLILGYIITLHLPYQLIGQSEIYQAPSTPEEHIIYIVENYDRTSGNNYLADYTNVDTTTTFLITQLSKYKSVRNIQHYSLQGDRYRVELEKADGSTKLVYIDITLKDNVITNLRIQNYE
jgi:uncharacterized protein YxeA